MTNAATRGWIEAANALLMNPSAVVVCPVCGNVTLRAEDISLPSGEIVERRLYCTTCDSQNFVRLGPTAEDCS